MISAGCGSTLPGKCFDGFECHAVLHSECSAHIKQFRNCLLAPVLMAINTRCLVSVSQMIHRGGRCQTAQPSYDGDNSVFMPEQNLSY